MVMLLVVLATALVDAQADVVVAVGHHVKVG